MNRSFIFCIFIIFFSCKKTQKYPVNVSQLPNTICILNEGNYGWGNAEVSYYNPNTKELNHGVFYNNNQYKLGDVLQSATIIDNKIYLVINNSNKIEIVDQTSFKKIADISTGLKSPRYLIQTIDHFAYVSDLYSNKVAVVDLVKSSVIDYIPITGWTENMLLYNNKVYITNLKTEYIYIVDPIKNKLEDSIKVLFGSNSIVKDGFNQIWVGCLGDSLKGYKGGLCRIDPKTQKVTEQYEVQTKSDYINKLTINKNGDSLYFINKNVYTMPIHSKKLPSQYIFNGESKNIYGLGIDPVTSTIYISDARDFVSNGTIYRLNPSNYQVMEYFDAGIMPNGFIFKK